jgi:hypothetical protein
VRWNVWRRRALGSQYGTTYKVASGDAVDVYVGNVPGPEFTIMNGTLP